MKSKSGFEDLLGLDFTARVTFWQNLSNKTCMLSVFKLWMQSGAPVISSELKTHQESTVELNFKFQVSDKSGIKLFQKST